MLENIQEKTENKIIDYVVLGSGGRLLVIKPENAGRKADLVVKRKGEYDDVDANAIGEKKVVRTKAFGTRKHKDIKEIYVRVFSAERKEDILKHNLDANNSGNGNDVYLIFTAFNDITQDIEDHIYVVPLDRFKETENKDKFIINKKDLAKFFIDKT